jgi:hypothetical protein
MILLAHLSVEGGLWTQKSKQKKRCGKGRKEENKIKNDSKIVEHLKASSGPPGGPISALRRTHQGLKGVKH